MDETPEEAVSRLEKELEAERVAHGQTADALTDAKDVLLDIYRMAKNAV